MSNVLATGSPDVSVWHPDLRALHRYWTAIHPSDGLPGRRHLEPADIAPYLPRIWLIDVQPEPFRLRYRLVGTRIVELVGRELTGQWLDEAHPDWAARSEGTARFRAVVESRRPSRRRGKPTLFLEPKSDFIEIENGYFPLASDGRTVDVLLCYTNFYDLEGRAL